MKLVLFCLASAVLATAVAAQTSANIQTSGSAQSDTSVSASQSGVVIPGGTIFPAVLSKSLDSKKNKQGDEVTAKTSADVLSQGKIIIPRNTKLIGHITEAKAKGNGESESVLGIVFDRAILKNGQSVPLNAAIQTLAAPAVAASSSINHDGYPSGVPSLPGVGDVGGGRITRDSSQPGGAPMTTVGKTNEDSGHASSTVGASAGNAPRDSGSNGVHGLKDLLLRSNSSSATGSLITSTGKNVKLESGSQLMLKVGTSTEGQ